MPIPPNTAVVLIDPYNDFLHESGKVHGLIKESFDDTNTLAHIKEFVAVARSNKIPIFYGLHQQSHPSFLLGWKHISALQQSEKDHMAFEEGSWGSKIYEGLEPSIEEGDVVVSKHWSSSSFQNTDLDYQLRQKDIRNLILGGITANTCLESTARYAYELGYNVTLLKDATAGNSTAAKNAATELIWPLFATVKTVAEWAESLK